MNPKLKTALAISAICLAGHAAAQITFYENEGYRGRAFTTDKRVGDFTRFGYNDRASSVVVDRGRWEVCEDVRFGGRCVVLRRGSYDSLRGLGLENRVSSVRPADNNRRYSNEAPEPVAAPNYEYRRRANEAVYQVPVTSVRAVVGPPNERCWVERQQVVEDRGSPNVGGAVLGAIIGGVLGHQIGSGRGNDAATVGGAVVGGAIGANTGRDGGTVISGQDVQRCTTAAPSGPPQYWDVTYSFRGAVHRVQLQTPPGPTITVNAQGLPRG